MLLVKEKFSGLPSKIKVADEKKIHVALEHPNKHMYGISLHCVIISR